VTASTTDVPEGNTLATRLISFGFHEVISDIICMNGSDIQFWQACHDLVGFFAYGDESLEEF
jgi:hypothetical protein